MVEEGERVRMEEREGEENGGRRGESEDGGEGMRGEWWKKERE